MTLSLMFITCSSYCMESNEKKKEKKVSFKELQDERELDTNKKLIKLLGQEVIAALQKKPLFGLKKTNDSFIIFKKK